MAVSLDLRVSCEVAHSPPCFLSRVFLLLYGDSKLGLSFLIWVSQRHRTSSTVTVQFLGSFALILSLVPFPLSRAYPFAHRAETPRHFPCPYLFYFLPSFILRSHFISVLSPPALALITNRLCLPYVRSRVNPVAPYPPSKPTRRPAHTHTSQPNASLSSTRRGSLPALHLHTSSQSTHTVSIAAPDMHENSENLNDDLYSHLNLAAFSFGAPQDADMPSPLSVQAPSDGGHSNTTGSTDRTPRPSISHTRDSGDSGGEDETRRLRAKIRAIDDGRRRPSLPTNQITSDRPSTDDTPGPSSRSTPERSSSDSEAIASGNTSDVEFDPGNDSGVVDTDVELEGIAPDDASQRTFGLEQVRFLLITLRG